MAASRYIWRTTGLLVNDKLLLRRGYATTQNAAEPNKDGKFDEETDVLIIGSGGAGFTAALRCHAHSLRSILVEKTDLLGGTTAYSGGGMWIPNNLYLKAKGRHDSIEKALTYMNHCIGDAGPASSHERRMAYLNNGPRMIEFLRDCGFQGRASGEYPEYYPDAPGGDVHRSLEPDIFDASKLGSYRRFIRTLPSPRPPIHTDEAARLFQYGTSVANLLFAAKTVGPRIIRRAFGQDPVGMGESLIAQLLYFSLQRNAVIWRNSPLTELIIHHGKVVGAVINYENRKLRRVRARRGVLLAAGGFAHNDEMRKQHQEHPITSEWTSTQPDDQGDAIRIGQSVNAQLALMDDAWWGPTILSPGGGRHWILCERALPFSIIVDKSGSRFMNEAQSYTDAGQAMFRRNREVPAIPAWLVLDTNHRKRYMLASCPRGRTPASALNPAYIHTASTLSELAKSTGIDPTGLQHTVTRFNEMARRGVDNDFGRGGNEYDRWFGDRYIKPNPNLGPIEKAPFFAVRVWPGDLGTKGGLLTDESAQVIDESGKPIPGLYAAGNTSASVMGRTYPGPGSTLGPALTFAYIAVNSMANNGS